MRLTGLNSWLRGSLIKAPSLTPPMRRGRGAYRIEKGVTMCIFCKTTACPCWPTLLRGRLYVQFLQRRCMSSLAYPVEKGVTTCIFCKKKCVSLLVYPVEKGVTMCIFRKKSACPCWSTLLKRVSLCAFCFASKTHVLVCLPC